MTKDRHRILLRVCRRLKFTQGVHTYFPVHLSEESLILRAVEVACQNWLAYSAHDVFCLPANGSVALSNVMRLMSSLSLTPTTNTNQHRL